MISHREWWYSCFSVRTHHDTSVSLTQASVFNTDITHGCYPVGSLFSVAHKPRRKILSSIL
jgi:hypothetical protein